MSIPRLSVDYKEDTREYLVYLLNDQDESILLGVPPMNCQVYTQKLYEWAAHRIALLAVE